MTTFRFALAPTLGRTDVNSPAAEPLRSYLTRHLCVPVELVRFGSYAETIEALANGDADAASVGNIAGYDAEVAGAVEPLLSLVDASDNISTYRCAIITRNDHGILSLDRLRGCSVGLVDGQSTSGYVVPRVLFREAGLDPDTDITVRLYPRHQDVVDAVLAGEVDAGAIHEGRLTPPSLDRGPDYARLTVIALSQDIPRGPIVVRKALRGWLRKGLYDALTNIHERDPIAARLLLREGTHYTATNRRAAPTLKTVAALAGVSYATVSRVINGGNGVAAETRARVQAIVDELGYAPNGNARVLLGRQHPLVGIALRLNDAAALAAVEQLRSAFNTAKVPLVVCPIDSGLAASPYPALLKDHRLGALVIFPDLLADPDVAALARTGNTVVLLGDEPASAPAGMLVAPPERLVSQLVERFR